MKLLKWWKNVKITQEADRSPFWKDVEPAAPPNVQIGVEIEAAQRELKYTLRRAARRSAEIRQALARNTLHRAHGGSHGS